MFYSQLTPYHQAQAAKVIQTLVEGMMDKKADETDTDSFAERLSMGMSRQ
jgi:hypothetical protein